MKFNSHHRKKWKNRDLIMLFERLELYVGSGLGLDRSLEVAAQGIHLKQKNTLDRIRKSVESGGLLSKSLQSEIGISQTLSGLISHGESSGGIDRALHTARTLMEREDELRKKCLSSMTYPLVIGFFAALLTVGLVRGIMPQIIPMLKSLNVPLPLLTRSVIWISENSVAYGAYTLIVSVLFVFLLRLSIKKIKKIRHAVQSLLLYVPVLGSLVHVYFLSVFLRSCGSLVESGVSSSLAYASVTDTVSFLPLHSMLNSHVTSIARGIPLSQCFIGKKMPPYIQPLLSAGEASGTLGSSIIRAADIIDRDIEHSLKRLTSLIEPLMMAGMGTVVGAIALSIMMPIYDISRVLQK